MHGDVRRFRRSGSSSSSASSIPKMEMTVTVKPKGAAVETPEEVAAQSQGGDGRGVGEGRCARRVEAAEEHDLHGRRQRAGERWQDDRARLRPEPDHRQGRHASHVPCVKAPTEAHNVGFGPVKYMDKLMRQTELFPFGPPNPPNQVTPFFIYGSDPPGTPYEGSTMHGNGFYATPLADGLPAPPPNAFSVTFAKAGKYHFICMLHGPDMAADIRVTQVRRLVVAGSGALGALLILVGGLVWPSVAGERDRRSRARVLDRGRARALERRPQRAQRDREGTLRQGRDDVHDDRLQALYARLGEADHEPARSERRQRRHPGPAASRRGWATGSSSTSRTSTTSSSGRTRCTSTASATSSAPTARTFPASPMPGGNVKPGDTFTYRLEAIEDSAGVWPYHDHSPSMSDSIAGGLYGAALDPRARRGAARPRVRRLLRGASRLQDGQRAGLRREHARLPGEGGRGRAVGRARDRRSLSHVPRARPPLADSAAATEDTRTIGPAESFAVRWREDVRGTWLYHCHVEDHMMTGMIGIYRVTR